MRRSAGFTLAEVVISIGVGLVIIAAIYAAVVSGQLSTMSIERKVVAGQDTRAVLDLMTLEIQMASYNPTYATNIWVNPGACTGVSANQNYRGIQAATASSITIEADINDNGAIGGAGNPNEIITYTFDAANQYITRSTNCLTDQPFLGDQPSSGLPRVVHVINPVAVPVFRYFDAQGNPITAAADIPNIARIDITLCVETDEKDVTSPQRRQMIYSANVIPRNHVIGRQ